ncbi:hypothetical protein [uncultured Clostridium sp.]|uniref:hypothetical protein n=1 Tax=uncultured Clostridium sp. TaxID=59620 RepID=UPI0025EBA2AB|nr:hypothetical protein [uncultured Clostridium sp.]
MKKYLNKGLMYHWFNSAKMMIFLGIIIWGVSYWGSILSAMNQLSNELSYEFLNTFKISGIDEFFILGIIFILIHFASHGMSKISNNMFLTKAPYTKIQIKFNEFICLMVTLGVFILEYLYLNFMAYIRYYNLMTIADGFFTMTFVDVLRIFVLGITGILVLLIIDSMFSNVFIGLVCMITLIPISFMSIARKFFTILDYIYVGNDKSVLDIISDRIYYSLNIGRFNIPNYISGYEGTLNFSTSIFIKEILLVFIFAIILFAIYIFIQKNFKLESNTKIFTSKLNEKIITVFISLGIGTILSYILVESNLKNIVGIHEYPPFEGMNLFKYMSLDIVITIFISIIVYKIVNKIVKSIE